MKRLLYITILLGVVLMSAVSSFKWRQISDVVTTLTEINYLHGITGKPLTRSSADSIYNQIANNINPHDSVYYKDESDAKYAPLINANLTNPTVTTQAVGDNSTKAASTAFVQSSLKPTSTVEIAKQLGSTIKAMTFMCETPNGGTAYTMADGTMHRGLVYIDRDMSITGAKCLVVTNGDFTADNFNGIGLYKLNGTNIEQVAISANDGSFWKVGAGIVSTIPFTSPYAATSGIYFVVALYNNSAQVVAPTLAIGASIPTNNQTLFGFPNNLKVFGTNATQTSLSASYTVSGATLNANAVMFILY